MSTFLDAVALINASQNHDGSAVEKVLASCDTAELSLILAQMVRTAIRTQGMTLDQFTAMQIDKTLEKGDQ